MFAASPVEPNVVLDKELVLLLRALHTECQVPVKGFLDFIKLINRAAEVRVSDNRE